MKIDLEPGKYVVAVSGGVDSMVLLDLLSKTTSLDIIVAHFNHGIRKDSAADENLVAQTAARVGLPFTSAQAKLGAKASEDVARQARYKFLEKVADDFGARAIITAHHQDDLIETAVINLLRGSGWRGLVAISQNPKVLRPLLPYRKADILDYADTHQIKWHDDSTNQDTDLLRNYIRQNVTPKLSPAGRAKLLELVEVVEASAKPIKFQLRNVSQLVKNGNEIDRRMYAALPTIVAEELMHYWLSSAGVADTTKETVSRLAVAVRTARVGSKHDAGHNHSIEVGKLSARLI